MLRDRRYVIIVAFDLPTTGKDLLAAYRKFLKFLKSCGYVKLQQSLYVKLLHYSENAREEIRTIQNNAPDNGNILILPLSLAAFKKQKSIGENPFDTLWFSDSFLFI